MRDMSSSPVEKITPSSSAVIDAVVKVLNKVLNQLPLAVQKQVLDFVEFLLQKHQALSMGQATVDT
jgi:hypothetical protein